MVVDLERFHQTFFEEAVEHLASMEAGLLELEARPDDDELLNAVFRGAHSIKGASGTFGFADVAYFTHTLENLLDRLRNRQMVASAALVDLLLRATDTLRLLIAAARQGGAPPPDAETVQQEVRQALGEEVSAGPAVTSRVPQPSPAPPTPCQRDFEVSFVPDEDLLRTGADPLLLLRSLKDMGEVQEVKVDLSRLPELEAMDPESCYLGWTVRLRSEQQAEEIADIFYFVQDHAQVAVTPIGDGRGETGQNPSPASLELFAELLAARAAFQQQLAGFCSETLPRLLSALSSPQRGRAATS